MKREQNSDLEHGLLYLFSGEPFCEQIYFHFELYDSLKIYIITFLYLHHRSYI